MIKDTHYYSNLYIHSSHSVQFNQLMPQMLSEKGLS